MFRFFRSSSLTTSPRFCSQLATTNCAIPSSLLSSPSNVFPPTLVLLVTFKRRIELIHDFQMPVASTTIKLSPDGEFAYVAGVYKPRIRCYELGQLSMKFERFLTSEVVAMEVLSEGYDKVVMLTADRGIEVHAK
jgi:hypothetical protein